MNEEFDIATEDPTPVTEEGGFTYEIYLNSYVSDKDGSWLDAKYKVTDQDTGDIIEKTFKSTDHRITSETINPSDFEEGKEDIYISKKYVIDQLEKPGDGYYQISKSITSKIEVKVTKNEEGKVTCNIGEITLDTYTENTDDIECMYGYDVAKTEVSPDSGDNISKITITINIYNVPRTYYVTGEETELNVILNSKDSVDLEPNISGVLGEVKAVYYINDTIKEVKTAGTEASDYTDDSKMYKGSDSYENPEDDPLYVEDMSGTDWYNDEWQVAVLNWEYQINESYSSGLGITKMYKIKSAGGIQALSVGTNDNDASNGTARTKIDDNTVANINNGSFSGPNGQVSGLKIYRDWEDGGKKRQFYLETDVSGVGSIQPIANFEGEFYGQNHTISGVTINEKSTKDTSNGIGLFASNNGTIQDLVIDGITVSYTNASDYSNYSGGAIGLNESSGTVKNITVQNSSITGNTYVGGVIGGNEANKVESLNVIGTNIKSEGDGFPEDNKNYSSLSIMGMVDYYKNKNGEKIATPKHITSLGGIVGISKGNIINCNIKITVKEGKNYGAIEFAGKTNTLALDDRTGDEIDKIMSGITYSNIVYNYVGGVVGYTIGDIYGCNVDIPINAKANSEIELKGENLVDAILSYEEIYFYQSIFVGGLAGASLPGNTENGIENSSVDENTEINASEAVISIVGSGDALIKINDIISNTYVGGALGIVEEKIGLNGVTINAGQIKGSKNIGGIAGVNYTELNSVGTTVDVRKIEGEKNVGGIAGEKNVGGIVGYNYGTVKGFTNKSDLKDARNIGGIVGYNRGTIYRCDNYGTISTTNNQANLDDTDAENTSYVSENNGAGGICGFNNNGTISSCANYGNITANANAGGIVGVSYRGETESNNIITMCTNKGTIKTTDVNRLGGIVGVCASGTITYCYNTGKILGNYIGPLLYPRRSAVGGIIGIVYRTASIDWCYNTAKIQGGNRTGNMYAGSIIGYRNSSSSSQSNVYVLSSSHDHVINNYSSVDGINKKTIPELVETIEQWQNNSNLKYNSNPIFKNLTGIGFMGKGGLWFETENSNQETNIGEELVENNNTPVSNEYLYIAQSGDYEVTIVGAGGSGTQYDWTSSYRGGGSGAAYNGVIYLEAGAYQYTIGEGGKRTGSEGDEGGYSSFAGITAGGGKEGYHKAGGGHTIDGGTLTFNAEHEIESYVKSNGNGTGSTTGGQAVITINGYAAGKGGNAAQNGNNGYLSVKLVRAYEKEYTRGEIIKEFTSATDGTIILDKGIYEITIVGAGGGGTDFDTSNWYRGGGSGAAWNGKIKILNDGTECTYSVGKGGSKKEDGGDSIFASIITAGGGKQGYYKTSGGHTIDGGTVTIRNSDITETIYSYVGPSNRGTGEAEPAIKYDNNLSEEEQLDGVNTGKGGAARKSGYDGYLIIKYYGELE